MSIWAKVKGKMPQERDCLGRRCGAWCEDGVFRDLWEFDARKPRDAYGAWPVGLVRWGAGGRSAGGRES